MEGLQQQDFSGGIYPLQERVPTNGLSDAVNFLIGDDGSAFKRGGTTEYAIATDGVIQGIWAGELAAGYRIVLWTNTGLYVLADDRTPILVHAADRTGIRGIAIDKRLWFEDGTIYAGERNIASSTTGTLTFTQGSKTLVGAGTTFTGTTLSKGSLILAHVGGNDYLLTVDSVTDNTHLQISEDFDGPTNAGVTYTWYTVRPPGTITGGFTPPRRVATAADRFIVAVDDRVYFSPAGPRKWINPSEDFWEIPGGVSITAMESLGDTLVVFTTGGTWTIGNLAYDLTDAFGNIQQVLRPGNRELIAWGNGGIVPWAGGLIVPAVDDVYLIDAVSAPRPLGKSILPLWHGIVQDGFHKAGPATVFRNHYILPVSDKAALVCRLDTGAWTRWGATTALDAHFLNALTTSVQSATQFPSLLGGYDQLLDLTGCFDPASAQYEADGSGVKARIVSRPFNDGSQQQVWRTVRVLQEVDASPMLFGGVTLSTNSTTTGIPSFTPESLTSGISNGRDPATWGVRDGAGVRSRSIQVALEVSDAATSWVVRGLELLYRKTGRQ